MPQEPADSATTGYCVVSFDGIVILEVESMNIVIERFQERLDSHAIGGDCLFLRGEQFAVVENYDRCTIGSALYSIAQAIVLLEDGPEDGRLIAQYKDVDEVRI